MFEEVSLNLSSKLSANIFDVSSSDDKNDKNVKFITLHRTFLSTKII